MSFHKFAFYGFSSLILFSTLIYSSCAYLRSYYIEDYCKVWPVETLDLRRQNSGMLLSIGFHENFHECKFQLKPEIGYSVVLSIYKFNLAPDDQLTITDSDKFQVALSGKGSFPDERKSFISDGMMTIHYKENTTEQWGSRVKFQFIFTQVHKGPCRFDEFQCKNGKCIPDDLVCRGHNHCGDNSNKNGCVTKTTTDNPNSTQYRRSFTPWIIIIACSVIVMIIIIVFIVMAVRINSRKKKESASNNSPPNVTTVVPTAPAAPAEVHVPPSAFERFRQSFRRIKASAPPSTEEPKTDNYEVPSMYPQLPSASSVPPCSEEPKTDNYQVPSTHPQVPPASSALPCYEEPKTDNYEVPSVYPQIPSVPRLSGVDNPEFKGDDN